MVIPTYYCSKCKQFKDISQVVPVDAGCIRCIDCRGKVSLSFDLIEKMLGEFGKDVN